MKGLELLEQQLKQARRVIWPATGQDAAIKFVYQLGDHMRDIYKLLDKLEKKTDEKKEDDKCEAVDGEAIKKENPRKAKKAKGKG